MEDSIVSSLFSLNSEDLNPRTRQVTTKRARQREGGFLSAKNVGSWIGILDLGVIRECWRPGALKGGTEGT